MSKNVDHSPFLFPSTFSNPSESAPSSSSSSLPPSFCSNSSSNSPYKSSSLIPLSRSSSTQFPPANFGPCAACKLHNRRRSDKFYIASFLPPSEVHNFAVVDSVFGSGDVVNFLQHNSNTSYTPLLLLLSREDEVEVDSDPKSNTEVNSQTQLGDSTNSDPIQQLIQGREQVEQLKLHLSSGTCSSDIDREDLVERVLFSIDKSLTILIANNNLFKSPDYSDASPGSVSFFETVECSALNVINDGDAKKRKTLPDHSPA